MTPNRNTKAGVSLLARLRDLADDLRFEADKTGLQRDQQAADDADDELEALENVLKAAHSAMPIVMNAPLTARALRDALADFE